MRVPVVVALAIGVGVFPIAAGGAAAQRLAQATPAPKPLSPKETYAAMTLAERTAIQSDLVWTGHYDGIIDGDFGNRSLAAVRAFQKSNDGAETGILNPRERARLATLAKAKQEQAGWRMVDDSATGVTLGLPTKVVPQTSRGKDGARWASASGEIEIETFRYSGPSVTLASVTAQLRAVANRKVDYDVQRPGFFVLIGSQGAKKFYSRAHVQDREVRGFTILYDAAKGSLMEPITVAMSNAFAPFSGRGTIQVAGTVARRKVEYTTGLVAAAAGFVLADRQATEGCRVIQIPQIGPAERVAADAASGLALLRVYGASRLRPAALAGSGSGNTVTLVGIADPSVQNGGGAITTRPAKLAGNASDAARTVDPAPPLGFSGAAAVDRRGGFHGILLIRPQVVAGPATTDAPAAAVVSGDAVRKFLRAHSVTPASGSAAVKDIRAAVVRVICVRS